MIFQTVAGALRVKVSLLVGVWVALVRWRLRWGLVLRLLRCRYGRLPTRWGRQELLVVRGHRIRQRNSSTGTPASRARSVSDGRGVGVPEVGVKGAIQCARGSRCR